ncbi:MAG: lipopolysaccharide kinase InaA family protein [Planctomycetota bacterium]
MRLPRDDARSPVLLRELPGRRVWREGDAVVKAFRHDSRLLRWRDRRRARREVDVLGRLLALGLPVPRPLGVERAGGAWCARIEWIEAVDLGALADRDGLDARTARRVGRALARFTNAGLDQPDWHPGNVLVAEDGGVFAIDFHKARIGAPSSARFERDALALAAHLRERADDAVLRAGLAAWYRGLEPALARALGDLRGLVAEYADRARLVRRAQVEAELDRWLRTSGVALRSDDGTLRRRGGDDGEVALEVRGAGAREHWLAQARLLEHRVPAARPLRLERDRALFDLGGPSAADAAGLGALVRDRALDRDDAGRATLRLQEQRTAPDGTVRFVPRAARVVAGRSE